jgi:PhnB protein
MSDSVFEPISQGNGICQCLKYTTDAEALETFDKLTEGGKVKDSLKPAFWGALFGQLEDKYGVSWIITTESKVSYT